MPQLSSGRHFGIAASGFVELLKNGSDTQKYALTVMLRLQVTTPAQLLVHTRIVYYDTSQGQPPHAPAYDSGFTAGMIQKGESDWSLVEVSELNHWLQTNPQLEGWLEQQYADINHAIRNSSIGLEQD